MARYIGPKSRIARRFGEAIFGEDKVLAKRPYAPGQHGVNRRKKNSEGSLIDESYKKAGIELGRKIAEGGDGLVFGGGANGMMGAVAEGVYEKGEYILGVIPSFFREAGPEISFKNCTEYIYTETMRERKAKMEEKSDAFIIVPGGIGTFDEFFEILTLKQLGRHNKAIAIYNINGFYDEMAKSLEKMVYQEFITRDCAELCKVFKDVDEVLQCQKTQK